MNTEQCTEITDNSTPLRQGDILYFPKKTEDEQFGVVVTGDCDIAQRKCRKIISYCTMTTATYYISNEILFDNYISKEISKLNDTVQKSVCKILDAENSNSFMPTLLEQENEYIRNLISDKSVYDKILLLKEMCNKSVFSFDDYKKLYNVNNKKEMDENTVKKVKEKLLSKLNSLPGDKYYITELPNQNDNFGYIVHLRYINTIKQEMIEKQTDLYRIGHLEAPYLYKLTQKLGAVFSDIGEPEKFEKNRSEINNILVKEL